MLSQQGDSPQLSVEMARAVKGGDAAVLPLMSCSSSVHSPLAAGMLSRLLARDDPLPHAFTGVCVTLFGHPTVSSSSFSSQTSLLLLFQSLNTLDDLLTSGHTSQGEREEVERCIEWLHCLEVYCHRYIAVRCEVEREASAAEAQKIQSWCKLIVSHLQPLPHFLLSCGHTRSCDSHMTRLSLHIHWTVISVAFRLAPITGWSWFFEQSTHSLSCLLSHAASLPHPSPSSSSSLSGCTCLRELWLLLRCSLDNSGQLTSFWTAVSSLIRQTTTHSQQPHPSDDAVVISPSDPVLFGWVCVEQMAALYGWREDGREKEEEEKFVPHWDIVHHLLPLSFKQGAREAVLRQALKVCVSLAQLWPPPPSSLPCLSSWDYFHRHIDDQFVIGTTTITEWATPEGSVPSVWVRHMVSLFRSTLSHSHSTTATDDCNSFQMFLLLICVTMATGDADEGKTWRALKGRFYSKLHRRWLSQRRGGGLRRVLSLLLTLAWAGDPREVAVNTVALLGQAGLSETTENSHLLWKAMFAMMLVLVEKREKLDDVIAKLQPALNSLVKPHPPESRDHQWNAVGVVLEGILEVMESGLELGACNLIGTHLSELLTSSEGAHLIRVLGVVESLCTLLSSSSSSFSLSGVNLLWQSCSQPLLSLSRLPLPPSPLPSTLAALTALTAHQNHTLSLTLYQEITKESVSPLLATAYLGHVIENDVIRHNILSAADEATQLQALHVWFRSLAEADHTPSPPPTITTSTPSSLNILTGQLPKLPLVGSLLGNQATPPDPMSMLKLLLEAMETSYNTLEGYEWRERLRIILGEMQHYLEPSVCGARGPSALRHAYLLSGLVVSKAPRLTYSRSDSRCLLPRLLDWLILPLSSSSSHHKPQPQGAASAIRANLHLFLTGLLKLGPVRDDFVKRKVKQLFSRYFHDCCQPRSPLLTPSHNPFLLALKPWCGTGYHGNGEELGLVMEVVSSQYLSLPQQTSSLSPTLQYIKNVVEQISQRALLVAMATPLIGHMTSCLLSCDVRPSSDSHRIKRLVMDILRPLLTACRNHQDLLPCSSLLPPLTNYISCNYSTVDSAHLATPLRIVGDLYPDLQRLLISHLTQDNHFNSLISHLL